MDRQITELLENHPPEVKKIYDKLRQIVFESAGEAVEEKLWARLPSYYVGEKFVRLIPFKDHINVEASAIQERKDELCDYKITPKGMLQIYVGEELPCALLKEIFSKTLTPRELNISLRDEEWPFEYTDHDRNIVRAIVYDDDGYFYFVRADRDDDFGKAVVIETSGGGVEDGEDLSLAIKRELREELGAEVEVVCRLGVVSDYYNLIHRHNINNFYLCRVLSFGEKHLTDDEAKVFHLSTLKLSYDEAVREYENNLKSMLGRIIYNREKPVLTRAKEILDNKRLH